ncbi:MAG TPA: hypothetical protein PLM63_03950 [bacterium]|nr:hypothetical protein [bacterium]
MKVNKEEAIRIITENIQEDKHDPELCGKMCPHIKDIRYCTLAYNQTLIINTYDPYINHMVRTDICLALKPIGVKNEN